MTEPLGDLLRVGALSDQQARARVPQIVEPERRESGALDGRKVASTELSAKVIHRRGCPEARYDTQGNEVDLYESYEVSSPKGVHRVSRCLLCGAHYILKPDGSDHYE